MTECDTPWDISDMAGIAASTMREIDIQYVGFLRVMGTQSPRYKDEADLGDWRRKAKAVVQAGQRFGPIGHAAN